MEGSKAKRVTSEVGSETKGPPPAEGESVKYFYRQKSKTGRMAAQSEYDTKGFYVSKRRTLSQRSRLLVHLSCRRNLVRDEGEEGRAAARSCSLRKVTKSSSS